MAERRPSQRLAAVIDVAFELLKRAVLVGALFYAAHETKSGGLEVIAVIANFLLAFWLCDKLWDLGEAVFQVDSQPKGSFAWWGYLLAVVAVVGFSALIIYVLISEVLAGNGL